jgi:uncharacterized protein YkwD
MHRRSLSYATEPMQKDLEQVFDDWINSLGHRANLLNPDLREKGIGVTFGHYGTAVETSGLYTVDSGTPQ